MLFKFCLLPLLFICLQIITMNYAQAQYAQVDANASASFNAGIQAQAGAGVDAGSSLFGSGVWGGAQGCPYDTQVSKAAVNEKDDNSAIRFEINKRILENKFQEKNKVSSTRRLESYLKKIEELFKPEVSEFIVNVHMSKMNLCKNYRTHPDNKCPTTGLISASPTTADAGASPKPSPEKDLIEKCIGLESVPNILKEKWIKSDGTGYCAANVNSSRGAISSSICTESTLKADTQLAKKTSPSDCSKLLADYRKTQIEYENAQAIIEKNDDYIKTKEDEIADAKEKAQLERERRKLQTESTPCPGCDAEGRQASTVRPQRDWLSTAATGIIGAGLWMYGRKANDASLESCAQLGGAGGCLTSAQNVGYPYIALGAGTMLSAAIGPGAYGCGGTFSGLLNGLSGLGGRGGNVYGANGGAFNYPVDMYGNPIGGGRFRPGVDINGNYNGLFNNGLNGNGQLNAGFQIGPNGTLIVPGVNSPLNGINGSLINCFAPPCPQNSGDWGLNGQLGLNGNGYLNSPQYQLQLMQQQQAMLQQQAQQQAQLAKQYEAEAQARIVAIQRQQAVQQQANLVAQQIQALQLKLQTLMYSNSSTGGSFLGGAGLSGGASVGAGFNLSVGAGFNLGVGGGANFNTGNTTIGQPNINNGPPTATVPGGSSPGTIRGR